MKYLVAKFKIKASEDLMQVCKDLLADSAAEAGFESFEETKEGMEAYVQKELFDKEILDQNIKEFPIEGTEISYEVEEAEDKDWNQEWEDQGFEPICIDDQILIYDAKHPDLHPTTSPDHIEIGIEAKLAFGTGNHETTRMIVSSLMNMNLYKKRVLDCGCGTGILGIVASKLGAGDVVGYDIDEWSVENSKHNAQLNGVNNMSVYFGNASVINHAINCNTAIPYCRNFVEMLRIIFPLKRNIIQSCANNAKQCTPNENIGHSVKAHFPFVRLTTSVQNRK